MISSPCYTCFTVLTLWASSFSSWSMGSSSGETEHPGKVTSGCAVVLLRVNMSNEETSLLTLSAAERVGAGEPVQRVKTRRELPHICRRDTPQHSAHRSSVRTSTSVQDLIPLQLTWRREKTGSTSLAGSGRQVKVEKAHLHNHHFNLHVRRQLQLGLESFHHGNQQMNGGQEVFVVDDWQASSRQ